MNAEQKLYLKELWGDLLLYGSITFFVVLVLAIGITLAGGGK